jgi:peptidoglycan hydrolase CwlO-like protein
MSVRHASANAQPHVAQLQKELNDLKATAIASNAAYRAAAANPEATPSTPTFEQLSGVEQSAASLGVHPDVRLSKTTVASCFALLLCFAGLKLTRAFLCCIIAELEANRVE